MEYPVTVFKAAGSQTSPWSHLASTGRLHEALFLKFIFVFFAISLATPMAYGGSQARGRIRAVAAGHIWSTSATYTIAHSNTRSLTHWVRPDIELSSFCILVGFVSPEPQWELLNLFLFYFIFFIFFCLFRAAPVAYGGSQARGLIGATDANLHHSHSNTKSEPHLWPTP